MSVRWPARILRRRKSLPQTPRQVVTLHHRSSGKKSIIFTEEGKSIVRNNPGVIRDFLIARKRILQGEDEVKTGHLTLERFKGNGNVHSALYKARVAGKTLFIKEQREGFQGESFRGYLDLAEPQIKSLHDARTKLQSIPGVEVANYHLAWTSGNNSFLVTDFYKGEKIEWNSNENYYSQLTGKKIGERVKRVIEILRGNFLDGTVNNFMYIPTRDTIVVFDLRPIV
jgi:hypothetical protein